jgi:hypothetical protein
MTDHATAHRTRIDLPDDVQPPYSVFVNGVRQRPGYHYEQLGRALYFNPRTEAGRSARLLALDIDLPWYCRHLPSR